MVGEVYPCAAEIRRGTVIPAAVLRYRGELSPMQALVHWLRDDPAGPGLSAGAVAEALGCARSDVYRHSRRAAEKLS